MSDSLKGRFLVAAPSLQDPNFLRSVVLMCEHNDEGALGLVLNRPSDVGVGDVIPPLAAAPGAAQPIRHGGPVQQNCVFVLHDDPEAGGEAVAEGVYYGAESAILERVVANVKARFRVFAGYAGWGGGQLEMEMEHSSWIVCPADAGTIFAVDGMEGWSRVLKQMGGKYAIIAQTPIDPGLN